MDNLGKLTEDLNYNFKITRIEFITLETLLVKKGIATVDEIDVIRQEVEKMENEQHI